MNRIGVLLINLGTPDAPTPDAVGRYLREFLMDGFVIDVPAPLRWFLVNVLIVPRRKYQSAKAYQKIQMPGGSPLLVHTVALADKVSVALGNDYVVEAAMRYGSPSIASALAKLKNQNVSRVIGLPLYPQYAESSFETAVVETKRSAAELGCADRLTFLSPFYNRPEFMNACATKVRSSLAGQDVEHVVFSFHGLPERHLTKLNGQHCLRAGDCCEQITVANRNCYRAQCIFTARAIALEVGLKENAYTVSFQSRLGREKWIGPNTEEVLRNLPARGIKRIAVTCPSFVADCLETIEEIGIRGRDTFLANGGEALYLVPSLNSDELWVESLAGWIETAAAVS